MKRMLRLSWIIFLGIHSGFWSGWRSRRLLITRRRRSGSVGLGRNPRRLRLRGGGGLYVTGRIKDMMIVRGKNCFPDDIEKSLRRDLPILRGRRFVVFQNAEDLIYCFVEEAIEAGGSAGVPGLARDGDDGVGSI